MAYETHRLSMEVVVLYTWYRWQHLVCEREAKLWRQARLQIVTGWCYSKRIKGACLTNAT